MIIKYLLIVVEYLSYLRVLLLSVSDLNGEVLGTALPGFRSCNPPMAKAE